MNFTGFGTSILFWYVEVIEYAMASETDGTFEEIEQINEGVEETLVGKEPGAKWVHIHLFVKGGFLYLALHNLGYNFEI